MAGRSAEDKLMDGVACKNKSLVFIHNHKGGGAWPCAKCDVARNICLGCPVIAQCREWVAEEEVTATKKGTSGGMYYAAGHYRSF